MAQDLSRPTVRVSAGGVVILRLAGGGSASDRAVGSLEISTSKLTHVVLGRSQVLTDFWPETSAVWATHNMATCFPRASALRERERVSIVFMEPNLGLEVASITFVVFCLLEVSLCVQPTIKRRSRQRY